jgi:hypothetical protein
LAKVHNVFHVSLLRKADADPTRVLPQVPVEVKEDLTLEVRPIKILDWGEKELCNKKVPIIRVLWRSSQIMGERIINEMKIPRLVYKLRYITQISRMKFLLGGENVNLGKKIYN